MDSGYWSKHTGGNVQSLLTHTTNSNNILNEWYWVIYCYLDYFRDYVKTCMQYCFAK